MTGTKIGSEPETLVLEYIEPVLVPNLKNVFIWVLGKPSLAPSGLGKPGLRIETGVRNRDHF